ncbi:MAG TPA: ELWxxDGT repeat protein [Candidatus Binatia bacterium]|nr:ELWxxDGT repeat protein [Candidatus Binatia bacterium]
MPSFVRLLAVVLVLATVPARAAVLPDGGPSPTFLSRVGHRLFFATYAAESGGWKVWTSDGTAQGTTLLRDGLGLDVELYATDDRLVFSTRGALWTSDGTPEGTVVVKELPFYPYGIKAGLGGVVFSDGRGQLWKSDLTADGTTLVADIDPGFVFHDLTPAAITGIGDVAFFRAINQAVGNELWITDGTSDGTTPFDLQPLGGSNPGEMLNADGTLYFSANGGDTGFELWRSDGTVLGTMLVKDIAIGGDAWPMHLRQMNGDLYFSADDGTGPELWRSDGTTDGTMPVVDLNPNGGSYPNGLLAIGGTLFFRADDGVTGTELWRTSGTPETTAQVADVSPFGGSNPANLRNLLGRVVFTADDGTHGEELWLHDVSSGDTILIADLNPSGGSYPHDVLRIDERLFFAADDGTNGTQLWVLDCGTHGTTCSTTMIPLPAPARSPHGVPYLVRDVFPGPGDAEPYDLTGSGGRLFFRAEHPDFGSELWVSDGTEDGTRLVRDISPGVTDAFPYHLTDVAGTLFFAAYTADAGYELWASDGTEDGTRLVRDINPGWEGSNLSSLTAIGDRLYFQAYRPDVGPEMWVSDGTEEGTVPLDIVPGERGSMAHDFTLVGDTLFFVGDGDYSLTRSTTKLWASDGTLEGSHPILDFRPSPPPPDLLTAVGDSLYFRAHGGELWRLAADLSQVTTVLPNGRPDELVAVGDALFFTRKTNIGRELWIAEGNTARLVKDIDPGPADGMPGRLTNVGGLLMFWATDGQSGFELWRSDGTEEGTVLVRDIDPTDVTVPSFFKAIGNVLFFSGQTPSFGYELWRSDGTTAGTAIVRNINPIASSYPESLAEVDGTLFFYAEDGRTGEELWAVTPCGNGVQNPGESCDDGNADDGDGCDAMCHVEPGVSTSSTTTTTTTSTTTTTTTSSTTSSTTTTTTTTTTLLLTTTSTTSSTSTSTTTTTSSTLPPPVEICGNCQDDDGDGLVDLADPACCIAPAALSLGEARVTKNRLSFGGRLAADALPAGDVVLQLESGGGVRCAHIPAAAFDGNASNRHFRNDGSVASAAGIDRLRLRLRRGGRLELTASGDPLALAAGSLRVIAALGDARCTGGTVTLRQTRKGLRYP